MSIANGHSYLNIHFAMSNRIEGLTKL